MTKHKTGQMVPFDYRWIDAQDQPDPAKLESISTFLHYGSDFNIHGQSRVGPTHQRQGMTNLEIPNTAYRTMILQEAMQTRTR